jgi:DNA-directed RNA polymerase specialized sigma24 family protein
MAPAAAGNDADLILAVQSRDDRHAYAELVRRHQSQVRAVLRRLTRGDAMLADDLAQDTFVLAWRNIAKFRFEARFSTWLYRIAFNAWQSELRKRREVPMEIDDDSPPPGSEHFDELPDVASRVDLSHEEAARALEMPVGTVKTHILRGKAKLKARLTGKEKP